MALSVYDAVIGSYEHSSGTFAEYPWTTWTSLKEAWAVAEHHERTDKDELKVYAALLVDIGASNVGDGHLALRGKNSSASAKNRRWQTRESPHTDMGKLWVVYMVPHNGRRLQGGNRLKFQRAY